MADENINGTDMGGGIGLMDNPLFQVDDGPADGQYDTTNPELIDIEEVLIELEQLEQEYTDVNSIDAGRRIKKKAEKPAETPARAVEAAVAAAPPPDAPVEPEEAKEKGPGFIEKLISHIKQIPVKKLAIVTAVVLACSFSAFFGVKLITETIMNSEPVKVEAENEYTPSHLPYDLGDAARRFAEHAGITGPAEPEEVKEEERAPRISVIGLLYPEKTINAGEAAENYISNLTRRMAESMLSGGSENGALGGAGGVSPGGSGSGLTGGAGESHMNGQTDSHMNGQTDAGSNSQDGHMNGQTDGHMNGQSDGAANGQTDGHMNGKQDDTMIPQTPLAPPDLALVNVEDSAPYTPIQINPTVPVNDPFPIEVLSFKKVGDVLISGNVSIKNNSEFVIENVFLLVTLNYELTSDENGILDIEKRAQYAYTKYANILPGEEKIISYATIPPVRGDPRFTLDDIVLTAFDTHIDGEPFKIYNNQLGSYLEVLAVGVY